MAKVNRILLAVSILTLPYSVNVSAQTLNVFNWSDYFDRDLIEEFEKDTGIEVNLSEYGSVEEMEKGLSGDAAEYDIVVPSHFQLPGMIAGDKLEELDFSRFKNLSNLDEQLLASLASFDGADKYAVPYLWTANGIALNKSAVESRLGSDVPNSWSLVFYDDYLSRLSGCGVSWIEAPKEVFSLKANFVGGNLNRSSDRTVKKYADQLSQSIEYVQEISNLDYAAGLEEGELCVAMAWSGHAAALMETNDDIDFILPDEGSLLTIDSWVILKSSPRKDAAYQFIDYMLAAESGRRNAETTKFFSHLPSEISVKDGIGLDPTEILGPDYRRKLYFVEKLDTEENRLIESLWQSVKENLALKVE